MSSVWLRLYFWNAMKPSLSNHLIFEISLVPMEFAKPSRKRRFTPRCVSPFVNSSAFSMIFWLYAALLRLKAFQLCFSASVVSADSSRLTAA